MSQISATSLARGEIITVRLPVQVHLSWFSFIYSESLKINIHFARPTWEQISHIHMKKS